jgi:hypothetical protein
VSEWFRARWTGRVTLQRLVGLDMVLVGTMINAIAGFSALAAYASGLGAGTAMALHFGTAPYNAFLYSCVWRHPRSGPATLILASAWFAAMIVV